jgi:type II secretion system protein I
MENKKSHKKIPFISHPRVHDKASLTSSGTLRMPEVQVNMPNHDTPVFCRAGFTLLEVLVATALLGIAVAVILQLFSANLRALSVSEDFVQASINAEAKMREVLDDDKPSEKSFSEITDDGYRMDIWIKDTLQERTDTIDMKLFQIDVTVRWIKGTKERSFTLRSLKAVRKQI